MEILPLEINELIKMYANPECNLIPFLDNDEEFNKRYNDLSNDDINYILLKLIGLNSSQIVRERARGGAGAARAVGGAGGPRENKYYF